MGWYKKATVVQETVAENAVALVLAGGFLLLAAVFIRRQSEVVIVPVALVLAMLLIKNIMLALILLLVVAYFAGIHYYPSDRGYGVAGGCSGLGFYMLLLLCLVLCAMFAVRGVNWWIPGVLLAACLLCLNFFSGKLKHRQFDTKITPTLLRIPDGNGNEVNDIKNSQRLTDLV
ncbi:hypothetical protein GUJ93_ZPchr0130g6524 [Zizania palustris]|uniref:Uncharacterized protein n=1 Tax=Zizania palustris TaxID=103762 RepID=A0A8J5R1S7_ZIZPA|nr:hypothetical protein GUJ93_ZPchr0130g6524 [Zizania palustris]